MLNCSCDQPGNCPIHAMFKTRRDWELCRGINCTSETSKKYWELWTLRAGKAATQSATNIKAASLGINGIRTTAGQQWQLASWEIKPELLTCIHRSEQPTRTDKCDLCGAKGREFDVYDCTIFGKCSLGRRHSKIKSCLTCEKRTAN